MSSQTFEILCPVCRSVVPPEAPGCPTCAANRRRAASGDVDGGGSPTDAPASVAHAVPAPPAPDLAGMPLKDYHRVVRATYHANEGRPSGSRVRAYLPFVLLLVLLVLGAAVIFGHLP